MTSTRKPNQNGGRKQQSNQGQKGQDKSQSHREQGGRSPQDRDDNQQRN